MPLSKAKRSGMKASTTAMEQECTDAELLRRATKAFMSTGKAAVLDMRRAIRLLTIKVFFSEKYSPYSNSKCRGMWQEPRPASWPEGVPFLDPNNADPDGKETAKGGKSKPSKQKLKEMFDFLMKRNLSLKKQHSGDVERPLINPGGCPSPQGLSTEVASDHLIAQEKDEIARIKLQLLEGEKGDFDLTYTLKQLEENSAPPSYGQEGSPLNTAMLGLNLRSPAASVAQEEGATAQHEAAMVYEEVTVYEGIVIQEEFDLFPRADPMCQQPEGTVTQQEAVVFQQEGISLQQAALLFPQEDVVIQQAGVVVGEEGAVIQQETMYQQDNMTSLDELLQGFNQHQEGVSFAVEEQGQALAQVMEEDGSESAMGPVLEEAGAEQNLNVLASQRSEPPVQPLVAPPCEPALPPPPPNTDVSGMRKSNHGQLSHDYSSAPSSFGGTDEMGASLVDDENILAAYALFRTQFGDVLDVLKGHQGPAAPEEEITDKLADLKWPPSPPAAQQVEDLRIPTVVTAFEDD